MKSKFLAVFVVLLGLGWGIINSSPDEKLHLIFCDVGQGDAILAVKGSTQILIDGGPSEKVLGCLAKHLPFWDRDLELVIFTHSEFDHLTGLVPVIERYNVKQIIGNSLLTDTGVFSRFRQEVIAKMIPVYSPKTGDKIKIGSLNVSILWPNEKLGDEIVWQKSGDSQVLGLSNYTGNFNETAIVAELEYGDFEALLTGDIGVEQEQALQTEWKPVEVLKVAHHGSKYSTSKEFLEQVRPALAVISVGANNRYGHPTSEVLQRLRDLDLPAGGQVKILRTDLEGDIEIVSDGKSWRVEK